MRINGFTQIKAFYSWTFSNQEKQIKPQHVSLYLFLLNQNNRNNWIEWFKCPFDLAMTGSCISSKKTYYKCLNELQEWKLIQYEKGTNNWKAPLIKLEVLKDTSTVPQSEPQVEQLSEPLLTLLPTHIYKLITNNPKLITEKLESWINFESKKPKEKSLQEKVDGFIGWFNNQKKIHTGIEGKTKGLSKTDENNLKKLLKVYDFTDFGKAIPNMFKNQWAKETNNLVPSHFLRVDNFNKYLNTEPTKSNHSTFDDKGKPVYLNDWRNDS